MRVAGHVDLGAGEQEGVLVDVLPPVDGHLLPDPVRVVVQGGDAFDARGRGDDKAERDRLRVVERAQVQLPLGGGKALRQRLKELLVGPDAVFHEAPVPVGREGHHRLRQVAADGHGAGAGALQRPLPQEAAEPGLVLVGEVRRLVGDGVADVVVPEENGARGVGHVAELVRVDRDGVRRGERREGLRVVGGQEAVGAREVVVELGGRDEVPVFRLREKGGKEAPEGGVAVVPEREAGVADLLAHGLNLVQRVDGALLRGAHDGDDPKHRLPVLDARVEPLAQRVGVEADAVVHGNGLQRVGPEAHHVHVFLPAVVGRLRDEHLRQTGRVVGKCAVVLEQKRGEPGPPHAGERLLKRLRPCRRPLLQGRLDAQVQVGDGVDREVGEAPRGQGVEGCALAGGGRHLQVGERR
ncbi:hypothetical protein SARU107417_11320 [Salinibacter ruber]